MMTVDEVTTDFALDGQNVVQERVGENPSATYFYGPDGVGYRQDDTTSVSEYDQDGQSVSRHPMRWYIFDGHGSVLAEVDNQGRINSDSQGIEHPLRRYEVYGNEIGTTPSTSNQKFCGSIGHTTEDNTGLIYMRARYYDPALGRFISQDPARDGNNWYAYCNSNPTSYVDPTGCEGTLGETLTANGAAAGTGGAGVVSLFRGVNGEQLKAIIENSYKLVSEWPGLYFSRIQQVAANFAERGGGVIKITLNANLYQDLLSSGLIKETPRGVEAFVSATVIGHLNTLYDAVEIVSRL
jgi:RHS repeat-associated protein